MKVKHLVIAIIIAIIVGVILGGISRFLEFDISPAFFAGLIPISVGVCVAISKKGNVKKDNDSDKK